jgi:hypothetical protein
MALLAQLPHDSPALDLGDPRWVLHLFQCTTAGCSTWSYDEGCNAAFILPREALGESLTPMPQAIVERPVYARVAGIAPVGHSMHGELWITGWNEHEDAIPQDMSPAYFDPVAFDALPEKFQFPHGFDHRLSTKTGGVPYWTANGPGGLPDIPPSPFDYLMQIDTHVFIQGRLQDPPTIGCDVYLREANGRMERRPVGDAARRENAPWEAYESDRDGEYVVEYANFGTDGTAYVFIDRQTSPPRALLFWNR